MRQIQSSLTGQQGVFDTVREILREQEFELANWEYKYGFFDRQLDERSMVFLRLPIETVQGDLDDPAAVIQFGVPFVLKHVYQTENNPDIGYTIGPQLAAFVNQFQEPADRDAFVEDHWMDKAQALVRDVEQRLM